MKFNTHEIETIQSLLYNKKILDTIEYLSERYNDERMFEDFKVYEKYFKNILPTNVEFIKGSKRPFGFNVKCGSTSAFLFLKRSRNSVKLMAKVTQI